MQASWLCLLLVAGSSLGARILGIFPSPSISHHFTYQPLMKALADRGHHVTVLSTDPLKAPRTNYTDIDLSFTYQYSKKLIELAISRGPTMIVSFKAFVDSRQAICDMQLSSKPVQDFIKRYAPQERNYRPDGSFITRLPVELRGDGSIPVGSELFAELKGALTKRGVNNLEGKKKALFARSHPKFDLVFYEDTMFYSYFGLIHHVGSPPIIAIHIHDVLPNNMDTMGNPCNPSYVPNVMLPFTDHMNFWERTVNTIGAMLIRILISAFIMPAQEVLMRKYFGDGPPSVVDAAKNYSLFMINRHDVISYPQPLLPTFIDIGGLHLSPKINSLPKDLKDYVEGAKHGFIYFSMGSNIKSNLLSEELLQNLLQAFAQLPQRVVFIWEDDSLPGLLENVKVSKWIPQQDLLAHPNIRLFITHGGTQSIFEAVNYSVPLLGFPITLDQPYQIAKIVTEGAGLSLDYKTASKEDIFNAVTSILTDPRYRENMKRLSTLLKDQPESPLQRAVWWTEYVLRHNGAKHLRSAALDLAWYQYYLLDVAALIIGVLSFFIFVIFITSRTLVNYFIRDKFKSKSE